MSRLGLPPVKYFILLIYVYLLSCNFSDNRGNDPGYTNETRPNFIFFIADDLSWNDLGAFGNKVVHTPNIDALAESGIRFAKAYLTTSSCSPSRASILTGLYPHNTGAMHLHQAVPGDKMLFPALLKQNGYHTASAGKWHLGSPAQKAFDRVIITDSGSGSDNWLDTLRNRPANKPYFMWLASIDPHRPYDVDTIEKRHNWQDIIVPPYLANSKITRLDISYYYDEISRLDDHVGMIIEELKNQGIYENTIVVFMSDNGRPFPRAKTSLYQEGIKIPLIISWPNHVHPKEINDQVVSSIDIAPTVLELSKIAVPPEFQGKSMVKTLFYPNTPVRQYAFSEHNWHGWDAYERSVRNSTMMYVRNVYPPYADCRIEDAPAFGELMRLHLEGKLYERQELCFLNPRPKEELFDLTKDPFQLKNLALLPKYQDRLQQMRNALLEWQKATDDKDYSPYQP
ncbi:MAG: sulfatase family protein [Methylococcales bacterium]